MHQQRRPPKMMFLPKYNQLYRRLGVWQGMPLLKGRTWKDVRQQPAVQFFALHGLSHTGSKVVHLWRSSKMEETAASCATARHQQDWLSIQFVIQFVMVHLERQDLHDRRWWGRCDLRAVWQIQCKKCSYDSYAKCREIYVESFPEPWKQPLGENHHEDRLWILQPVIEGHGDMLYDSMIIYYTDIIQPFVKRS